MLSLILFFFGLNRGIMVHIAPFITDLRFSLTTAGRILAVSSGVSIGGRLLMGQLFDTIGARRSLIFGFILFTAAFAVLLVGSELWMLYLWAVLFGLAWGGVGTLRFSVTGELFGVTSLGAIIGIIEIFPTAGSGISPTLAGRLFDTTNSYQLMFLVSAAFSLLGLIMSCFLTPAVKNHEARQA